MKKIFQIISIGLIVLASSCMSDNQSKEKSNDKEVKKHQERASIDDIEKGIREYIKDKTSEGEGYFHLKDGDKELRLKLVRVHTEYLSNLGPQYHFACVDLAEESGDVYDVDFFLRGKPGNMRVTETTLHKLNGKPFYTWEQAEDKTWQRVPMENATPELLGVIEEKDTFEFHYRVRLPELKEKAKMWLPVAQSDRFQNIKIVSQTTPVKSRILKEEKFGNRLLYMEPGPEHSHDTIEIIYRVGRKEKGPYKEPGTVPENHLSSNPLIPTGGKFTQLSDEIIEKRKAATDLEKARALYDYIIEEVQYKKAGKYGTGDAQYACDSRRGNCTEFHSFFISLARSAGIPARFAIGAAIPSGRDEGGVNGYHCWAEFYDGEKWWPVDISEANKYSDLATYYFGHHPANRIELSRGRELSVSPSPLSGTIKFMAYPILESGGKQLSPETEFSFSRIR